MEKIIRVRKTKNSLTKRSSKVHIFKVLFHSSISWLFWENLFTFDSQKTYGPMFKLYVMSQLCLSKIIRSHMRLQIERFSAIVSPFYWKHPFHDQCEMFARIGHQDWWSSVTSFWTKFLVFTRIRFEISDGF